jgi:hypothetical protein
VAPMVRLFLLLSVVYFYRLGFSAFIVPPVTWEPCTLALLSKIIPPSCHPFDFVFNFFVLVPWPFLVLCGSPNSSPNSFCPSVLWPFLVLCGIPSSSPTSFCLCAIVRSPTGWGVAFSPFTEVSCCSVSPAGTLATEVATGPYIKTNKMAITAREFTYV